MAAARKLNREIWVGATPTAAFLAQLSRFGIRSVICNQQDAEEIRILTSKACEAIAGQYGMDYAQCIVEDRHRVSEEEVLRFKETFERLPKPVFVYCRAGYRAALVWAMAQLETREIEDLVEEVFDVGYDLTLVGRPQMDERKKRLGALPLKDDSFKCLSLSRCPHFTGFGHDDAIAGILIELVAQGANGNAENSGGMGPVTQTMAEGVENEIAFHLRNGLSHQRTGDDFRRVRGICCNLICDDGLSGHQAIDDRGYRLACEWRRLQSCRRMKAVSRGARCFRAL